MKPAVDIVSVDAKFTQSSLTEKDKYTWAKEVWDQYEVVEKDSGLSNVEKVKAMIAIRDKTVEDKKYAATSYLMTFSQNIMAKASSIEQNIIKELISEKKDDIEQYRNSKQSNNLVKKTDDVFTDLNKEVYEKIERKQTLQKFLNLVNLRLSFYQDENESYYDIHKNDIEN